VTPHGSDADGPETAAAGGAGDRDVTGAGRVVAGPTAGFGEGLPDGPQPNIATPNAAASAPIRLRPLRVTAHQGRGWYGASPAGS